MKPFRCGAVVGILAVLLMLGGGCQTRTVTTGVENTPTSDTSGYVSPEAPSRTGTANTESLDIISCAKYLVGKMLANPTLVNPGKPRIVIVDAKYFVIDATQRIDKEMVINRLRTELINAANGRIRFVSRESAAMVEEEKDLAAEGITGPGTTPASPKQLGGDYRLRGSIRELATNAGGRLDKYTLMTFEMVDLQTGEIVFSDQYEFKKLQTRPYAYR